MHNKFIELFIIALCLGLLTGCGVPRSQVSGKVTYEDGSPVISGNVKARTTDGIEVTGIIKKDGSFLLYEMKSGDGIPAGKQYKVWLANTIATKPSTQMVTDEYGNTIPAPDIVTQLVHSDFTNPESSPLTLDVQGATMPFDIKVKKP